MKKPVLLANDKLIIIAILAIVFIINIVDVAYVFTKVHSTSFIAFHITAISAFAIAAYFIFQYAFKKIRQKDAIENKINKYNRKLVFHSGNKEEAKKDPVGHLEDNLKDTIKFIQEIGKGNYEVRFERLNDSNISLNKNTLTGELLNMRHQMKKVAEEEKQRSWTNQGIAKFSELLRKYTNDFEHLGDEVVMEIVKYLGANQGGIFIIRDEKSEEAYLELIACYAYERKKYTKKTIHYKEGLAGQCYMEADTIFLTDVPKNYVSITSGLGEATPTCLVLIPLKLNESVEGVLEIATFKPLEPYQLLFLEKLGESIASTVRNIKINENTNKLLQDSQLQTEQLKAQEEEMRQNMEELAATQEELERKSRESQFQFIKLNAILDSAIDPIITINEKGRIEMVNKATEKLFGYSTEALVGQESRILMPELNFVNGSLLKKEDSADLSAKQKSFQGRKRGGEEFPVEVSFNEVVIDGNRLFTAILRDVSERIEHEKEQQQMIEEMRATEEELRQNMEELHATQEEVERQLIETSQLKLELEARENVFSVSTILSEADIHGTIIHVNDKLCEVSMYSREELVGQPHNIFRHPDMPKEAFKLMWSTIKKGNIFRGIVKNRRKDGGHYWVDAVIAPVFNEDGKVIKYIGARYHITEDSLAEALFEDFLQQHGLQRAIPKAA